MSVSTAWLFKTLPSDADLERERLGESFVDAAGTSAAAAPCQSSRGGRARKRQKTGSGPRPSKKAAARVRICVA
jgi:hypothetical protein